MNIANHLIIRSGMIFLLLAGMATTGRAHSIIPRDEVRAKVLLLSDTTSRQQVQATVFFRIGESRIDPDFEGNMTRLAIFISALEKVLADPDYVISRMVVVGTASPDGTVAVNNALAARRAEALAEYLKTHTTLSGDKIEVVNGGENWAGLRRMMEESTVLPHKEAMLALMDIPDSAVRKRKMMYYADSKPWLWMYDHFFPDLRKGAGGTHGRASLNALSRTNWNLIGEIVGTSQFDDTLKTALLEVIDKEQDPLVRMARLRELCSDTSTYKRLQSEITLGLLSQPSVLSADNWTLLREKISQSDMPFRSHVVKIIDSIPATRGREQALLSLEGGVPYRYIVENFLPELLISSRQANAQRAVSELTPPLVKLTTTLGEENWKRLREMVAVSDMPHKDEVLALIDNEKDAALREQQIRMMNNGETYRYINEVFFPELLYGISPAAQQNWRQATAVVAQSDLLNREAILKIIRTTLPGLEREEAIRALDAGESWRQMGELLLPELLQGTEDTPLTGSGISFYYELSPAAKARAAAMVQRTPAQEQVAEISPETQPATQPEQKIYNSTKEKSFTPIVALKTDLMLWGGVMPNFKIGTWTPNLSAEVYFARRWSAQLGFAYANWDAFSGDKGLYAVSTTDLALRHWFGKRSAFRGFYLGVYGQYGQYDVQQTAQGQTGSFWCAGLGAGWLQPLSKRWALEVEVRGGYRSAQNEIYDIEPGHTYYNSKQTDSKFTPQVRLQVVYRFGKSQK